MQYNKYDLFRRGVFIEQLTTPDELSSLITRLHPVQSPAELVRVGADADGGYLVPDDLADITACFSPGVETNASFEMDLMCKAGIPSHLADYSVDAPPPGFSPHSFTKKYLGAHNDEQYMSLDSWVKGSEQFAAGGDFLLQMDIEGGEYATILGASEEVLNRFRILVIEVHKIDSWGHPNFFNIVVKPFFDKLLKHFVVVHNHPNNNCGIVNLGGVLAPRVFELTLLRKDRSNTSEYVTQLPHRLDRPNVPYNLDLLLPINWFRFVDPAPTRRYVLCRPQGGLTDQLCQIGKCITYAQQHDRTVIVDTSSNISGMVGDFSKFFVSTDPKLQLQYSLNKNLLLGKSVFPVPPGLFIDAYPIFYSHTTGKCYFDNRDKDMISFDFSKDYDELVLLHHQVGGGAELALSALSKLVLHPDLLAELERRYLHSGGAYHAVHIRNTDIQSDYEPVIEELKSANFEKLFVATDNLNTLNAFVIIFGSKVLSYSHIPQLNDHALHISASKAEADVRYQDAICDLLMLGMSSQLILCKVRSGHTKQYSGFSQLAQLLFENQDALRNLLSKDICAEMVNAQIH